MNPKESYQLILNTPKIQSIIQNPEANEMEIAMLHELDPLLALQHPNCPHDVWWRLVVKYPMKAKTTPLFGLLTLEDPERWHSLEREYVSHWTSGYFLELSDEGKNIVARKMLRRALCAFANYHTHQASKIEQLLTVADRYDQSFHDVGFWLAELNKVDLHGLDLIRLVQEKQNLNVDASYVVNRCFELICVYKQISVKDRGSDEFPSIRHHLRLGLLTIIQERYAVENP
jgi:hypothetical protein